MGDGSAWGAHLSCKEENRWVRFPYRPLKDTTAIHFILLQSKAPLEVQILLSPLWGE